MVPGRGLHGGSHTWWNFKLEMPQSLQPSTRAKDDSLFSGLTTLKGLEDCQNLSGKYPLLPEGWTRYLQRAELQNTYEFTHLFQQILADSAALRGALRRHQGKFSWQVSLRTSRSIQPDTEMT